MAARKPLFMDQTEGFSEEMAISDSMTLGGLTMGGNIDMNSAGKIVGANAATADGDVLVYGQTGANLSGLDVDTSALTMNGQKVTGLADGASASQDAATVAQMEAAILTGNIFKEPVHGQDQLIDGASGGIRALEVLHFEAQPIATDTVVLKNGTLTRTYTFVANQGAESAATDVSIESSALTAMERLVGRANADVGNTQWELFMHAGGEVGDEIHVTEKTTPADALSTSRIYGVWGTQTNVTVVPFSDGTTAIQYNVGTEATMPTADPAGGRFGFSRAEATLEDGEVHLAIDINAQFSWEDSAAQWNQISGVGAIPDATAASGGGVKGVVTFDSDKGMDVLAGVASVDIDAVTLDFNAGSIEVTGLPAQFEINGSAVSANVDQAALDVLTGGVASDADGEHTHNGLASSGHTHTHASTTGQGTDDHHAQSHTIASHSDTSGTGAELDTLTDGSNADALHVHASASATEAPKVENTLTTATDAVAVGDPVYANGNDTVGKSLASDNAKARVLGVIRSGAGAAPQAVEVVSCGPAAGAIAGATFGTPYYLQNAGGIGTSLPSAGGRVIQVGFAVNATTLWVDIKDFAKRAA